MKLFVPLTIIFSIYIGTSFAITFDMPPKSMKCFLETYPKDQLVKGKVEFNDQILRLRFWVWTLIPSCSTLMLYKGGR